MSQRLSHVTDIIRHRERHTSQRRLPPQTSLFFFFFFLPSQLFPPFMTSNTWRHIVQNENLFGYFRREIFCERLFVPPLEADGVEARMLPPFLHPITSTRSCNCKLVLSLFLVWETSRFHEQRCTNNFDHFFNKRERKTLCITDGSGWGLSLVIWALNWLSTQRNRSEELPQQSGLDCCLHQWRYWGTIRRLFVTSQTHVPTWTLNPRPPCCDGLCYLVHNRF